MSSSARSERSATKPVPLPQRLAALSKEQLVKLVTTMLERCPDLNWVLDTLPGAMDSAAGDALFDKFYGMAQDLIPEEMAWRHTWEIGLKLDRMLDIAADFEASGNPAGSVALFRALLQATLESYDYFHDEGEITDVIRQCGEGIAAKLAVFPPGDRSRGILLDALFRVLEFDVRMGGLGAADSIPQAIVDAVTGPERQEFAARVRYLLGDRDEEYSEYRRAHVGGLLLELEASDMDDESCLRICRETGRHGDLVDRLLVLGRRTEAVTAAKAIENDYRLLELADVFALHGETEAFETLLAARVDTTDDTRVWEWLGERYRSTSRFAPALDMARRAFGKRPNLSRYAVVQDIASAAGNWDEVRAELLRALAEEGNTSTLVDIHLHDGDIWAAIQLLEQDRIQGRYVWRGKQLQVAHAAATDYPLEAVVLYQREAAGLIRQRNRPAYAEAAQHLLAVRRLLLENDRKDTWDQHFAALLAEVKSLPACKDEMRKAKLIP
jgi:tetratricopeptide (TPR) repeat protein